VTSYQGEPEGVRVSGVVLPSPTGGGREPGEPDLDIVGGTVRVGWKALIVCCSKGGSSPTSGVLDPGTGGEGRGWRSASGMISILSRSGGVWAS